MCDCPARPRPAEDVTPGPSPPRPEAKKGCPVHPVGEGCVGVVGDCQGVGFYGFGAVVVSMMIVLGSMMALEMLLRVVFISGLELKLVLVLVLVVVLVIVLVMVVVGVVGLVWPWEIPHQPLLCHYRKYSTRAHSKCKQGRVAFS